MTRTLVSSLEEFGFDFSIFPQTAKCYSGGGHRENCLYVQPHLSYDEVPNFSTEFNHTCCYWQFSGGEGMHSLFEWASDCVKLLQNHEDNYHYFDVIGMEMILPELKRLISDFEFNSNLEYVINKKYFNHFMPQLEKLLNSLQKEYDAQTSWCKSSQAYTYAKEMNALIAVGATTNFAEELSHNKNIFEPICSTMNDFVESLPSTTVQAMKDFIQNEPEASQKNKLLFKAEGQTLLRLETVLQKYCYLDEGFSLVPATFKPSLEALQINHVEINSLNVSVYETFKVFYKEHKTSIKEAYELASMV